MSAEPESTAIPTENPTPKPGAVLLLWSSSDRGIHSAAHTLSGLLSKEPHNLETLSVDLPESLGNKLVLGTLISLGREQIEVAALSSMAWPAVESQLSQRKISTMVALDPLAAALANAWRRKGLLRVPLVGVLCSLRFDPAWGHSEVDRLTLADLTQAEEALKSGMPAECLVPCGIPVCGGFSSVAPEEKETLRRHFNLEPSKSVVLLVTDGLSPEQLTGALFQLSLLSSHVTLLFDVARDESAAELLRRRASFYEVQAHLFGKVDEAPQLWGTADIVVAKPHVYVEQRALAMRLPYVCLLPQNAREKEIAQIYFERGIGRIADALPVLAAEVELQLAPDALDKSQKRMSTITKRSASGDVARFIAQVTANAQLILGESHDEGINEFQPSSSPTVTSFTPSRTGPLEPIGSSSKSSIDASASFDSDEVEDLQAAEAEANRLLKEHQQETERWERRRELSANTGDNDLRLEAEKMASFHRSAMHKALDELARLYQLRRRMQGHSDLQLEEKFRRLEVEEALQKLKQRLKT